MLRATAWWFSQGPIFDENLFKFENGPQRKAKLGWLPALRDADQASACVDVGSRQAVCIMMDFCIQLLRYDAWR